MRTTRSFLSRIVATIGVGIMLTVSVGPVAQAASQAGGVPELQALITQLRATVAGLQAQVDALARTNRRLPALARRVSDLESKNATQELLLLNLQSQVQGLAAPSAIRGFLDGGITSNVLGPFPGTVLYRMNVPEAGSYVVIAKMTAWQRKKDGEGNGCRIIAGGDADNGQSVIPPTVGENGSYIDTRSTITLLTTHTFSQQNEVLLQCWNNGSDILMLTDIEIVAIKVNTLSTSPLEEVN